MTVSAYVLIQTDMDKAADVARAISAIEGVVAVDVVTGPYDVIAKTTASTMDELGRMVVGKVQKVPGINRTLTSPVVNL
jgi:DNA-binding Lrp family transcriptional regulator